MVCSIGLLTSFLKALFAPPDKVDVEEAWPAGANDVAELKVAAAEVMQFEGVPPVIVKSL